MALLASTVMDGAAVILNDVAKSLFTYAIQLPFLQRANRDLEKLLIEYGAPQQRARSANITVLANATTLTLPADFLLPSTLYERVLGSTSDLDWVELTRKDWEPFTPSEYCLLYWAFRNNNIYFLAATTDREVKMDYERSLAVITSSATSEDFAMCQNFLEAKTAEYCARFVGMNETIANSIRDNECFRAQDSLVNVIVLNSQGVRYRRKPFTTKRVENR